MNLGVDIGGTFTDVVAYDPATGVTRVGKTLNGGTGSDADLLRGLAAAGIEPDAVEQLTHGTTVVTNLLIERTGAVVGLLTTRGFRDVLEIRRSYRERSIDLDYVKSPPIVPRRLRVEVGGRIGGSGEEVEALAEDEVAAGVRALLAGGAEALAIAFYNAYANPTHERRAREIAAALAPGVLTVASTDVDARIGEYERVTTCVLNTMAMPRMERYVGQIGTAVTRPIHYMHSAGGVLPPREARERPIQLAFSGPAAGVLAGREVARQLGFDAAITMDMGGTSCDVSLIWQGDFRYRDELEIEWDVPARIRSLDVHTIGAGGGSICWADAGGALKVGPRSAGAVPGPACYGRLGTEPTVTDANLALGILPPQGLLGGDLPLDVGAALEALGGLGVALGVSAVEVARGAHAIVSANMAQAIREITVRKGIDPRDCLLVAFGGAGPQHAAAVASHLGIRHVTTPALASVLSALGLLTADVRVSASRTLLQPLADLTPEAAEAAFAELEREASMRLGDGGEQPEVERLLALRYVDQAHEISIPYTPSAAALVERFEEEHERLYGTRLGDPVEIVDCAVTLGVRRSLAPAVWRGPAERASEPEPRRLELVGDVVPVYARAAIAGPVTGPCLLEEETSVTVVPEAARVRESAGHLVMELAA